MALRMNEVASRNPYGSWPCPFVGWSVIKERFTIGIGGSLTAPVQTGNILQGLCERSRRPHWHPYTAAPEVAQRIVDMKLAHQSFGPKKVMDRLHTLEPDAPWPADSTAGDILKRNGLVRPRRKRRRVPPNPHALLTCDGPARHLLDDMVQERQC